MDNCTRAVETGIAFRNTYFSISSSVPTVRLKEYMQKDIKTNGKANCQQEKLFEKNIWQNTVDLLRANHIYLISFQSFCVKSVFVNQFHNFSKEGNVVSWN